MKPAAGSYREALTVSIVDATKSAVIHYTTDGTVPTTHSRRYSIPCKIDKSTVVKAIASAPDDTPSAVVTADYAILPRVTATILYSFGVSATDARYPVAGVIQGSDGDFYGTTAYGGKFDSGTVFFRLQRRLFLEPGWVDSGPRRQFVWNDCQWLCSWWRCPIQPVFMPPPSPH